MIRRVDRAGAPLLRSQLAWACWLLAATGAARGDIDVRTSTVCMHLGAVAVGPDGSAQGLFWPDDNRLTAIFAPVRTIAGAAQIGTAPDPADPSRRMGRCLIGAPDSSGRVRYRVSDGVGSATRETPGEFWFESEFEFRFDGALDSPAEAIRFLEFTDAASRRIQIRLRGGSTPLWQAINSSGQILPGAKDLLAGDVPQEGRRYAFRLHWDDGPGLGADGTLRFVTVDLEAGVVLHDTTVSARPNTEFAGFTFLNDISGPLITSAEILWDHVTYSAIAPPGAMTSPLPWSMHHRLHGPAVGAQRSIAGDEGRIEARIVAVWPDGDLGSRREAARATIRFEHRRRGDLGWTAGNAIHDVRGSDFGFASETIRPLDPLTEYEFRAVYTRDGETSISRSSVARTLSARDGAPGTLRLGSYSCISAKAAPVYAPAVLARRDAHEIQCLGDLSYTNNDMGYNRPEDYLAWGTFEQRRLEWNRLLLVQILSPTVASGTYANASHWATLDDHLFRDDLAGGRETFKSGDGKVMLDEIGGFVEDTVCRLFFPTDGAGDVRRYWWSRETARTLSLFLECRQAADHAQTRSPKLPVDSQSSPWNGLVDEGDRPLVPADTSTWGTTVLGAPQTAHMVDAVAATTKPLVIIHSPIIISNGSQREYQDTGSYPEIWDILQACEANPAVKTVAIISGDLHLAMVVPGRNVPSPARMAALGKPATYPKLLWEAMLGGGGQGGHRLRWQVGNEMDADGGLRGGRWDGPSEPRWDYAADFNSWWPGDEVVECWDYELDRAVTWDGSAASGITAKQERVGLLTIDEANMTLTLEVIDLQTEEVDYSRTDPFGACDCPADWNRDCVVDARDVLHYLSDWARRDPDADLNGDGTLDGRDVLAFLNGWALGC